MSDQQTSFTDEGKDVKATGLLAISQRLARWEYILAMVTVVIFLISVATTSGLLDGYNIQSSLSRMAPKALMVLPLTFLIIAREIDISVASVAGLSGISLGICSEHGVPVLLAVLVALLVGLVCGAINGFFVRLGLPSLIVTLGTLSVFRGVCYILVGGTPVSEIPSAIITLGNNGLGGTDLPLNIVPFIVLAVAAAVILHSTPLGRRIFAIGGNPATARYAGVHNERLVFGMFLTSGVIAAMAGVINVGINSSASPDGALGFELDAVTIVFLGGVSFLGGKGRMTGIIWSLLAVITIRSALQLHNVAAYAQAAVVGLLLIGSLLAANLSEQIRGAIETRRAATRVNQAAAATASS